MLYYIVFKADFGPKEHVFSPVRRGLQRQLDRFWTLTPQEEARVSRDAAERRSATTAGDTHAPPSS